MMEHRQEARRRAPDVIELPAEHGSIPGAEARLLSGRVLVGQPEADAERALALEAVSHHPAAPQFTWR